MRKDDTDASKRYFRSSERVFRMNSAWYFATREGDQGPYSCEEVARAEVDRFLTERQELAHFQDARERAAGNANLSVVPLDERTHRRPSTTPPQNRKVMI